MIEFYEWRKENTDYLRVIIQKCSQAHRSEWRHFEYGEEVREIATQIAEHLKCQCQVIPLGGPQYGQLFRIINDVLRSEGEQR